MEVSYTSWGYHQIIQVMDDQLSIESHGDLGILHFICRYVPAVYV
jgi:hypothetical protein